MDRDELIEKVKAATTVYVAAEVCGIRLPRPGVKFKVPWRPDKSPSASILPDERRIHDFSRDEGKDGLALIQEMRDVSFPVAVNLAAEHLGAPLPFEAEFGAGRSRVLVENLGRWPGAAVANPEPVEERQPTGGGLANFTGISDRAADATIRACCRALLDNEEWLERVAEWRGFAVSFVRALADEGRLGAALNEAGELCIVLPCTLAGGLWVRAQVRKVGPRAAGCEWFWPAKSDHKPGPWIAGDGAGSGLLVVGEGWGDAAAARCLLGEAGARVVATLGTGVRKLDMERQGAREVLILRQNEAGGDANARWARSLRALFQGVPVRSVCPPAGVKDWNDALARHGWQTCRALWEDAVKVPEDEALEGMTPEMAGRKNDLWNDMTAAEMLAEVTEGRLKHDAVSGWHELQDGGWWLQVPPKRALWWAGRAAKQAKREALEVMEWLRKKGGGKKGDTRADRVVEAWRFATLFGGLRMQKAAVELAAASEEMSAKIEPWAVDKWLLPVANGMLDLRREAKAIWRPFTPGDSVTWRAAAEFDETASCPQWLRFMDSICDGDKELAAFLQRWAGYMLTGDVSEQVVLFLYGMGSNGKSTFFGVLQTMMGEFARVVPQSMVTLDRMGNAAPDVEVIRLRGARFVVPPELEKGARLAEANVKTLTGGDRLRGRAHYQSSDEFKPSHKLGFFSNTKPNISGGDEGIWRRMLLVWLRRCFKGAAKIARLDELLLAELSGILNWCIVGCWEWQKQGLNPPASVLAEIDSYRDSSDALGTFLDEHLERVPLCVVTIAEVRKRLKAWADAEGEGWLAGISTRKLRKEMEERGWEVKVDRKNSPFIMANWRTADDESATWEGEE